MDLTNQPDWSGFYLCQHVVQEITSLSNNHSADIHKDRTKSSMDRDSKDMQSVLDYFTERRPFATDCIDFRSMSSGIVADKSVNVDSAEVIGTKIITSMEGMSVSSPRRTKSPLWTPQCMFLLMGRRLR